MTLDELKIGQSAVIKSVGGEGTLRQHFLDMGVIPGARTTLIKFAPMGDPMELRVHGYELTLRLDDAKNIEIGDILEEGEKEPKKDNDIKKVKYNEHPGFGEEGKYHKKKDGNKLPEGTLLTFALAGRIVVRQHYSINLPVLISMLVTSLELQLIERVEA